ncbi:MAG: 50S ribosomal protein L24 [Anaerolineales bacterium]|nr:50S ribosomal protein L24 [Anaerolineales bacterium]
MKIKIRKGDQVQVISGKDRGKRGDVTRGEVIKVLPKDGQVVVQGVNIRKKHQRQVQTQGRTVNPGIVEYEAPIQISNVMLVCPKCSKPTRIGLRRDDDQTTRVCKECGADID